MGCNTCKCGLNNALICSKIACVSKKSMTQYMAYRKAKQIVSKKKSIESQNLPTLPKNGVCTPGKIYQNGCNRCFCDTNQLAMCTTKACHKKLSNKLKTSSILTLSDVRPEITEQEAKRLKELPDIASRCDPGQTVKVDCNYCACLFNRILVCDEKLCLSYDDMNRIAAKKKEGDSC
ncbi:unnamed protein product [Diatraea saccharalis]|uniref:Pacifastin domain-containing protein n=1 Tax=Diatraea saccharalis TaxID=40085 RepID=A0A9N9RAR4_9NEOP|nr:unnamed protein product [Diatraea saccharalis]